MDAPKFGGQIPLHRRVNGKGILWIFALCVALFVWTGAIWLHDTYGDLSYVVADPHFLRSLEGSRRSFAKGVLLPPTVLFFILCLSQRKIRGWEHERILLPVSCLIAIVSFVSAAVYLDAGTYVARQYRLHQRQWYDENRIVAHALGEIDGQTYSNSREALEESYQKGARCLECNLSITADRQLVACHDWNFCLKGQTLIQNKPSISEGYFSASLKKPYSAGFLKFHFFVCFAPTSLISIE